MITLPKNCKYSIYYIQALLNSKYLEWYSALIGEVFRGSYIARGTKVLKKLPIRKIDFDNPREKSLHDSITNTQQRLIEIQSEVDQNQENKRVLILVSEDVLKEQSHSHLSDMALIKAPETSFPMVSTSLSCTTSRS